MHQIILPLADPTLTTDHLDRDGLNNQRGNLRAATKLQQSFNRDKVLKTRTTSLYKGVRRTISNKWQAGISIKGKYKNLGSYKTQEEAAMRYDEEAFKLMGEFAFLNFNKDKVPY